MKKARVMLRFLTSQRSIILLVPILIVLLALATSYLVSQKEKSKQEVGTNKQASEPIDNQEVSQTTGWKTYRNEKYKYTLDYPSELSVLNESDGEVTIWHCPKEFQFEEYGGGCKGHPGFNYLNLRAYDEQREMLPSPYPCILEDSRTQQDTIILAGKEWVHYQYTIDEIVRKKYCSGEPIPSDNNRLLITNLSNSKFLVVRISNASDEPYELLNQILSTLRFDSGQ